MERAVGSPAFAHGAGPAGEVGEGKEVSGLPFGVALAGRGEELPELLAWLPLDVLSFLLFFDFFLLLLLELPFLLLPREFLPLTGFFSLPTELGLMLDLTLVRLTAETLCCLFPATLGLGSALALAEKSAKVSAATGSASDGGPRGIVLCCACKLNHSCL